MSNKIFNVRNFQDITHAFLYYRQEITYEKMNNSQYMQK